MYLGKVIGTVVSTVKAPSLTGSKFLIVEKINQDLTAKKQTEIAVDTVGAGDGDRNCRRRKLRTYVRW